MPNALINDDVFEMYSEVHICIQSYGNIYDRSSSCINALKNSKESKKYVLTQMLT